MKNTLIITIMLVITLSGCAEIKPPQNHYYLLEALQSQHVERLSTPTTVRVELAQFLAQGSLVLQLDEQQVLPSHYHRWAEPLSGLIERYLQRQLQQRDETHQDMAITVIIDRFHGSPAGDVWLSGQWWDNRTDNPQPQQFDYQASQQSAGYDHLVIALQQLLDKLANEIAQ